MNKCEIFQSFGKMLVDDDELDEKGNNFADIKKFNDSQNLNLISK